MSPDFAESKLSGLRALSASKKVPRAVLLLPHPKARRTMGIGRSRPAFIHNDLRDSVHAVADGHENSASSCLACLCPPGRSSSPKSLQSRGSRTVLGGSYDDELDDKLGSPVPDTPEAVRRVREAATRQYMSSNGGEEKKSGSFQGLGTKESSKYFGLERESSKLALNEMDGANGSDGSDATSSAEICDGPVSSFCPGGKGSIEGCLTNHYYAYSDMLVNRTRRTD